MDRSRNFFLIYFCGLTMALVGKTSAVETIELSSGHKMPVVGLGTWQMKKDDVDKAVTAALDSGYTHIDTAFVYENEEDIGKSLKKWFDKGGKREDLFITTKLPMYGIRASDVENFLKLSLERLGLQYVDMYLIHVPVGFVKDKNGYSVARNEDGSVVLDESTDHISTWKAMEDQVKAGRTKSIGLSNFNESQVLNVVNNAKIKPSNLQIELQAYNQQKPLRELCAKHGIVVTGYSTLGSPGSQAFISKKSPIRSLPTLLENPLVQKIALNHKKTPAQVLLRHAVQNNIIVIPKSTHPDRIKANIDIFDFKLTPEEMKQMDDLDKGEDGRLFDFLVFKGIEKHPQYPFRKALEKA